MAAVSAGESDIPAAGAERSAARAVLIRAAGSRGGQAATALAALAATAALALHFDAPPRHEALQAVPDVLRILGASVLVFGIAGFGLVRLALPAALRRYELLWVLPAGACAVGVAMTLLGFAAVPYPVSLGLVLVAGAGLAIYAVRRRGWPALAVRSAGWPAYLATLVACVVLVPMVVILRYAAPVGDGSDAHVATGVAQFLQHTYPTGVNLHEPINQMQPTWQSKYPIYYAFAAISTISGLATWQVLATLAALLLAMAAVGMFLVAREVFAAPLAISLLAMCFAALDRMALHTVLNPYFNQTWGFFTLPFTLVLGWWAVQSNQTRRSRRLTVGLLALFALVLVLAYPLAAPIPAVPLAVFVFVDRRRRRAAGQPVRRVRNLYRGRRSLLWIVPVAVLLAIPVAGAIAKAVSAAEVLAPGHSLANWGGDLSHFIAWNYFFSLPDSLFGTLLLVTVLLLAAWGLARQPRPLSAGLGGLLALGLLIALYLRHRPYGYYFEFKLLAFLGPLTLLIAVIGAGRLIAGRRMWLVGVAWVSLFAVIAGGAVFQSIKRTGFQLPQSTIGLSSWADRLPAGASVRLDMAPGQQLWAAYFMVSRPLCSQTPLLGTAYPHVPVSRKADYIVVSRDYGHPADATGPPLRKNDGYFLYRENPTVPGVDHCSTRRLDQIYQGPGHSAR